MAAGEKNKLILSHRIQLDPTAKQMRYFAQACGTARLVWNWALAEWNDQYAMGGKPKAVDLKRYFNSVKYEKFPWMTDIHRDAHSQPFANLQTAFGNWFAGRGERPKFKRKGKTGESFYCANDKLSVIGKFVRLPMVGRIRMTELLRFIGKIQSATVSREADRWFISIAVEIPDVVAPSPTGEPIGVDLGLTTFAVLSNGERVAAPKPLAVSLKRLRRLSRSHSRKMLGSNNRRKAAMKLARHHRRVRNIRSDFVDKFTTSLAKNHSEICVEDLNVSGMMRNRCLSRAISDVAWSETRRQLFYKCPMYGSKLTVRDRFFASSKLCSACGAKRESLALSDRTWTCTCGAVHDRDENASTNILNGPSTEGYSGINALGDCGSGPAAMTGETAVDEQGTTMCMVESRIEK